MTRIPDYVPTSLQDRIRLAVRTVPNFPQPGVLFRDIAPVLADGALFREVVSSLSGFFRAQRVSHVAGVESRGFILGAPIAVDLRAGFVSLRKAGRLPGECHRVEHELEYGTGALEMQRAALDNTARVLIFDDVLATGGTAAAAVRLICGSGASIVGLGFMLELSYLQPRVSAGSAPVRCLVRLTG